MVVYLLRVCLRTTMCIYIYISLYISLSLSLSPSLHYVWIYTLQLQLYMNMSNYGPIYWVDLLPKNKQTSSKILQSRAVSSFSMTNLFSSLHTVGSDKDEPMEARMAHSTSSWISRFSTSFSANEPFSS